MSDEEARALALDLAVKLYAHAADGVPCGLVVRVANTFHAYLVGGVVPR